MVKIVNRWFHTAFLKLQHAAIQALSSGVWPSIVARPCPDPQVPGISAAERWPLVSDVP